MATATVQTERQKPTKERFASGKLRPKKAESRTGSKPPPPETKRGCYVCGSIQRGDAFTSLPDQDNIGRVVHIATVAIDGRSANRNVECLGVFKSRVEAAQRQQAQHEKENLALSSLRREGGNIPRLEHSSQRGFDCTVEDCSRFFDTVPGRDLHLRRGHKVG